MAIQEARRFLPSDPGLFTAYDQVNLWHSSVGNTTEELVRLPAEEIAALSGNYVGAGAAYFANHGHDEYMREVGASLWHRVHQGLVPIIFAEDIRFAAVTFGVRPEAAVASFPSDDVVFTTTQRPELAVGRVALLFVPPDFIFRARKEPVHALAATAYVSSQVRDYFNGRQVIDPRFLGDRADATEAHFLKFVLTQNPEMPLTAFQREILSKFPNGIDSLPSQARYKGDTGEAASKLGQN